MIEPLVQASSLIEKMLQAIVMSLSVNLSHPTLGYLAASLRLELTLTSLSLRGVHLLSIYLLSLILT